MDTIDRARMPSPTGWSVNGVVNIPGTGIPIFGSKAFGLQVKFPKADAYTIQFSRRLTDAQLARIASVGAVYRAQVLVTSTVEGNSNSRRLDVTEGSAITVTAQSLNVEVYNNYSFIPAGPADSFDISLTVAPGVRAQSGSPPIVASLQFASGIIPESVYIIASGATAIVPIPPDSGCNAVFFSYSPNPGNIIQAGSSDIQLLQLAGSADLAVGNVDTFNRWWPLVPSVNRIGVVNNSPGTIGVTPILGIQG